METADARKGFTLIENIIVIVVLVVVISGSLSLYPLVTKVFVRQEARLIADNIAYSQIEDLRRIARVNGFGDAALTDTTAPATDGPTADIIVPPGFTLNYTVTTRGWAGGPGTTVKEVSVICAHTASGMTETLTADVPQ